MPAIASLDALERAAAGFEVTDLDVDAEPTALAAVRRSLADPGLLLLGEVHGVRENPLLCRALMVALGATGLALEWDEDLAPVIDEYIRGGPLRDRWTLWSGDGRITAGHLAVLREGRAAGWLRTLTLFDGTLDQDWDWSGRDAAMAGRVLAAGRAAGGTLVVAGNAHTRTVPTDLGVPLGARLAERHPGIREVRIRYGGGGFYNGKPRRFARDRRGGPRGSRGIQLHPGDGELVLSLPRATEAVVPQRPRPWEAAGTAR
jgi:erythromycin esterase-like protein